MASGSSTCVWRSCLVMKNAIFRTVPVLGQMYTYVMIMCI